MKQIFNYLKWTIFCSLVVSGTLFTSCESEDEPGVVTSLGKGVFVLNEGGQGKNNAGLTFRSFENLDIISDVFSSKLGDTAQDMLIYGSNLYISVSGSSYIKVINANSRVEVKNIPVKNEKEEGREPRYLAPYQGNIYASTYDGNIIRIDTATLSITGITTVGPSPEGIAVAGEKIYVANSDGLNWQNGYENGKSVSVVDMLTFKEIKKIQVGVNPFKVYADKYGDVYVNCKGNYDGTSFYRIDSKTDEAALVPDLHVSNFIIEDDISYFYDTTYEGNTAIQKYGKFNVKTETLENGSFITDGTVINVAYAIGINPANKEIYVSDAIDYTTPGTVYVFDSNGKKTDSFDAGICPSCFVFNR